MIRELPQNPWKPKVELMLRSLHREAERELNEAADVDAAMAAYEREQLLELLLRALRESGPDASGLRRFRHHLVAAERHARAELHPLLASIAERVPSKVEELAAQPTPFCPGKRRFATRLDAELVVANSTLRSKLGNERRNECRSYFCRSCNAWHVSSRHLWSYEERRAHEAERLAAAAAA